MNNQSLFTYEQAAQMLVQSLPELRDAYQEMAEWWGPDEPPAAHPLYDEILIPYIHKLLASDGPEADLSLTRVFAFIERLASSQDDRLRDLVGVTICERLVEDRTLLSRARRYMGRATLKICRMVERG